MRSAVEIVGAQLFAGCDYSRRSAPPFVDYPEPGATPPGRGSSSLDKRVREHVRFAEVRPSEPLGGGRPPAPDAGCARDCPAAPAGSA